jgi:CubicO group peptidase (beta-lactamase class C family)
VAAAIQRVESSLLLSRVLPEQEDRVTLLDCMGSYGVPGLSVAVVHDGRLEWAQGVGVRHAGHPDPITADTLFQAGSISKAVTAVATLRLCRKGVLDLDEEVNAYLRSWAVPANDGWQPRVTLRHLLSHTAGTTVSGYFGYRESELLPTAPQILDGVTPATSRPVRVNAIPGTQFSYSGGGTMIVQQVLTDVTGEPFPALMARLVFEPLDMRRSTFDQRLPLSLAADAAVGHWMGDDAVDGGHPLVHPQLAAGGLWTTPSDLARLLIDVWHALSDRPAILLDEATARQMLRPQGASHIGLGFFLSGEGAAARFGHSGDTLGFNADMIFFREIGCGAVALANSITGMTPIGDVFRTLAEIYGWPDLLPTRRREIPAAPPDLTPFAGEYCLPNGFGLRVYSQEADLLLEAEGQPPLPLHAFAADHFFARAVSAELAFTHGPTGAITGFQLHQPDTTVFATRVD